MFTEENLISKMLNNLLVAFDTFQTMWKTINPGEFTAKILENNVRENIG